MIHLLKRKFISDLIFIIYATCFRGPTRLTITNISQANTTAVGDIQEGVYRFAVQVWDQEHLSSEVPLFVHVDPAPGV